jgi:hypothetical protein
MHAYPSMIHRIQERRTSRASASAAERARLRAQRAQASECDGVFEWYLACGTLVAGRCGTISRSVIFFLLSASSDTTPTSFRHASGRLLPALDTTVPALLFGVSCRRSSVKLWVVIYTLLLYLCAPAGRSCILRMDAYRAEHTRMLHGAIALRKAIYP